MTSFVEKFSSETTPANMVAKLLRERTLAYAFQVKQPNGKEAHIVLRVAPAKYDALKRAMDASTPMDLADYGDILYTGWTEPNEDIKAELNEKYGLYA